MRIRPQLDQRTALGNAKGWAIVLTVGYVYQLCLEYTLIRFTRGTDGRWVASMAQEPEPLAALLLLLGSSFSLIAGIGFVRSILSEWEVHKRLSHRPTAVTSSDVLYMLAWLHFANTVQLFLYTFFLPYPLFREGTVGGLLESASLQVLILLIAGFMFRGRSAQIGFCRPQNTGGMLVALFGMFLLIVFALDLLLTKPIADLLQLSLESEREQGIESEILAAKANHWLTGLWAVVIVGIFVPLAEEVMYRGVIQTYLVKRWGAWIGILLTSFWFALIHFDIALFVPLFVIGLALGLIRHLYRSLWGAILLHSLNNLTSVLHYYF